MKTSQLLRPGSTTKWAQDRATPAAKVVERTARRVQSRPPASRFLVLLTLALIGLIVAVNWPDIQRYNRMRNM